MESYNECRNELFPQFFEFIILPLQDAHTDVKDSKEIRSEKELVDETFTNDNSGCSTRKLTIKPFVPSFSQKSILNRII
jgi:hypothetical protein